MTARTIFVGRANELAGLAALARDGARLITLWGPGGVGKTTLARHHAERQQTSGECIVWADLASARTAEQTIIILAAAFRTILDGRDEPTEAVVRSATAQRAILVADNAEQLEQPARDVLVLIAERTETCVVVTSRDPLGATIERAIRIDPLPEAEALALFTELSGTPPDEAAHEIVRRLSSLPLAIELAAARVPLLGSASVLARLDRKLDLLGGDRPDRPSRHATLRAAIAWSWDLLDDRDRAALMACAAFEAPFDAAIAARAIAGDELVAIDALERLRLRALIHVGPSDEDGRPQLHLLEAVRDFVRSAISERGAAADVYARHAEAVVERAEPLAEAVRRGRAVAPGLVRRRADLLFAASLEQMSDALLAARAALALAALLSVTGPLDVVIERVDHVIPKLDGGAFATRLAIVKGEALRAMGRHEEAEDASRRALAFQDDTVPLTSADALRLAGLVARSRGDASRAIEMLSAARERYGSLGERALEGICLGELAAAYGSDGHLERARALHQEAIAVHVTEKSQRAEGVERSYLAVATHRSGAPAAAVSLHEAALSIHRRVAHHRLEGAELLHLGFVHHELGVPRSSRDAFEEARRILGCTGARGLEALALVLLARLEVDEGNAEAARVALAKARVITPPGWARLEATHRLVSGHLAMSSGDAASAIVAYEAALATSRDVEVGFEALTPAYLALALSRSHDRNSVGRKLEAGQSSLAEEARESMRAVANPHIEEALSILVAAALGKGEVSVSEEGRAASSEVRRATAFSSARRGFVVADEARRVVLPDGREIDLARRKNVRRLLFALAKERRDRPGSPLSVDALVAAGWPGERMRAEASLKRLHTGIWTLRSLGLEELLLSRDDGYLLDPKIRLILE